MGTCVVKGCYNASVSEGNFTCTAVQRETALPEMSPSDSHASSLVGFMSSKALKLLFHILWPLNVKSLPVANRIWQVPIKTYLYVKLYGAVGR